MKKIPHKKSRKNGFEFDTLSEQLKAASLTLPQSKLEELKSILHRSYVRRFAGKRKTPKYGSINKGFTELELQHFLRNVPNEKFRLLFKYQAMLGLRVGEVCKLHVSNIDSAKRELTIKSEKSGNSDTLRIPTELFDETKEFVDKNSSHISSSGGYIFFKENDNNHNNVLYIDIHYARKVFRETADKIGLNQVYDCSEETFPSKKPRRLYRLTTHSLRHYSITKFARSTNGNVVQTCRFARHSVPATTMRYIAKDSTALYESIDLAFSDNLSALKKAFPKM